MPASPKAPLPRALATAAVTGALVLGVAAATSAATPTGIARVNVATGGAQTSDPAYLTNQSVSGDGRYVVFESSADDVVTGDTNNAEDIFLHDTTTGTTTRISVGLLGAEPDDFSVNPVISDDGAWIAFVSWATNLVPADTNGTSDVFLAEVATGAITRISVSSAADEANGESYQASISSDGGRVAFTSLASNLVAGDTNGTRDVFVHDRVSSSTTRVSVADDESQADGDAYAPAISGNGAYVAFVSSATNLVVGDTNGVTDVFRRDLAAGSTVLVSVASDGTPSDSSSSLRSGGVSADGSRIVFHSGASTLVPGGTNGISDVLLRDLTAGTTTLVSAAADGTLGDDGSDEGVISSDGSTVAFTSYATNLVPGYTGNSGYVYAYRIATGELSVVSTDSSGTPPDDGSSSPSINDDGTKISFASGATNLVTGDTNGSDDAFLATLAYAPAAGSGGGGGGGGATLPPTGMDATVATIVGAIAAGVVALGVVTVVLGRRRPRGRRVAS